MIGFLRLRKLTTSNPFPLTENSHTDLLEAIAAVLVVQWHHTVSSHCLVLSGDHFVVIGNMWHSLTSPFRVRVYSVFVTFHLAYQRVSRTMCNCVFKYNILKLAVNWMFSCTLLTGTEMYTNLRNAFGKFSGPELQLSMACCALPARAENWCGCCPLSTAPPWRASFHKSEQEAPTLWPGFSCKVWQRLNYHGLERSVHCHPTRNSIWNCMKSNNRLIKPSLSNVFLLVLFKTWFLAIFTQIFLKH